MVQFFDLGKTRSGKLSEILGQSLGEGLGEFTGNYFANRSLESVLQDKALKKAPISERLSKLETALSSYGERGQRMLQKRLGIEQQALQEKQEAQQLKSQQSLAQVFGKLQRGEQIDENEFANLEPNAQKQVLQGMQQFMLQKEKNKKTVNPPGGLSGQPVPAEISQSIPKILNENKDANADELASAFDQQGIPRTYSNSYIENRRRQDESKTKLPNLKAELGVKRDNELLSEADKFRALAPTEEASLSAMEDAVTEGNQSFFSLDNIAEKTGIEWFRTAKGGQFKTAAKTFLINNVSKFGARPNQYIEQQIADALAKVGRDEQANLASISLTRFDSDVKKKFLEVLDEVEQSGDYEPGRLGSTVQKQMKPIIEKMQQELSNKLHVLSTNDALGKNEVYVYDPEGNIAGTIDRDQINELPEGYHAE